MYEVRCNIVRLCNVYLSYGAGYHSKISPAGATAALYASFLIKQ